jgi:hypothetical protein
VDPCHKGPEGKVIGNVVLHIKGRGRMDFQLLARTVEGENNKEGSQTQGASRGRHIDKDKLSS